MASVPEPGRRGGRSRRGARRSRRRPLRREPRSWPGTRGGASGPHSRRDHPLAVVDPVLLAIDVDRVVAGTAVDLVELAVAGVDHVVAGRTLLDAVAHVELIGPGPACDSIRALAAQEDVGSLAPAKAVPGLAADEGVVPLVAEQPVPPALALDQVVATSTEDPVGVLRSLQHLARAPALDRLGGHHGPGPEREGEQDAEGHHHRGGPILRLAPRAVPLTNELQARRI